MTELLLKIFLGKKSLSPDNRESYGTFASIVGIFVNLLLSFGKMVAGLLSGSVGIIADSLNNFSDAGSSIVSLISFKIAAKPADRNHPFGHARIEYISSMIVSFIILLVGFELFSESVRGFFSSEAKQLEFSYITYVILGVSVLFKLWLAIFYTKISKKIDSQVIKASAQDSLFDCVATSAVLISSAIIELTDIALIDSIIGLGVSVVIIVAGLKMLNETKNTLLGEAPVEEIVDSIYEVVKKYPEVIGVHDLMVHNYGPKHYIASFHAEVDGEKDIFVLHDVIDNIEREITNDLGIICTIHLDPIVTNDETLSELCEFTRGIVTSLYSGANIHDFRVVIGQTHTNLIFDVEVPFEVKDSTDKVVDNIKTAVLSKRDNHYCVITVDKI